MLTGNRPRVTGYAGPREMREIARLSALLDMSDGAIDATARRVTGKPMNWERMYLGNAYRIINAMRAVCRDAGIDFRERRDEDA